MNLKRSQRNIVVQSGQSFIRSKGLQASPSAEFRDYSRLLHLLARIMLINITPARRRPVGCRSPHNEHP
jgi:hypothetical protein